MRLLPALVFLLALGGCAATVPVAPPAYADTSARLDGRRVTVVLADGSAWRATALRLGPDSTSWFDAARGALRTEPTSSVVRVEHRDRGRQAQMGGVRGLVGGALLGIAMGFALSEDRTVDAPPSTAIIGALLVAPLGAAAGALGAALGAALGNTPDRYVLAPPDTLGGR